MKAIQTYFSYILLVYWLFSDLFFTMETITFLNAGFTNLSAVYQNFFTEIIIIKYDLAYRTRILLYQRKKTVSTIIKFIHFWQFFKAFSRTLMTCFKFILITIFANNILTIFQNVLCFVCSNMLLLTFQTLILI